MSAVVDRYTTAVRSSNLRLAEHGPREIHAIIAAGKLREGLVPVLYRLRVEFDSLDLTLPIAVVHADPATRSVFKLLALRSMGHAQSALTRFLGAKAAREGFVASSVVLEAAVGRILETYLLPTCPACLGVRFRVIPGTGRLSDEECEECAGTGERPFKFRSGAPEDEVRFVQSARMDISAKMAQADRRMGRTMAILARATSSG